MEDQLILAGLPYVIHGGVSFYERKEVKDIVSYFQMAIDPDKNDAFKRVYNVPTRYLGKAFFEKVQSFKGSHWEAISEGRLNLKGYEKNGVNDFMDKVHSLQGMIRDKIGPSDMLDWILSEEGVNYKKYILGEEEEEESSRMENIETLRFVLERYEDVSEFLEYIQTMTSKAKHSIDGVQLMTFHKSKGLEYPVAFNIGVSDGLLPHFRSIEDSESGVKPLAIEEERRLLYVGITRAESLVYVSSINSFNGRYQPISRFVEELGVKLEEKEVEEVEG
jgi:DNA helicase-2/ATP-dependent DNA helicase PcrA